MEFKDMQQIIITEIMNHLWIADLTNEQGKLAISPMVINGISYDLVKQKKLSIVFYDYHEFDAIQFSKNTNFHLALQFLGRDGSIGRVYNFDMKLESIQQELHWEEADKPALVYVEFSL